MFPIVDVRAEHLQISSCVYRFILYIYDRHQITAVAQVVFLTLFGGHIEIYRLITLTQFFHGEVASFGFDLQPTRHTHTACDDVALQTFIRTRDFNVILSSRCFVCLFGVCSFSFFRNNSFLYVLLLSSNLLAMWTMHTLRFRYDFQTFRLLRVMHSSIASHVEQFR